MIKKEQLAGSQKVIVGDKNNDLVLRTLGRIYIQTAGKLTPFNEFIKTLTNSAVSAAAEKSVKIITSEDQLQTMSYPGDGSFIYITSSGNLYIAYNGQYVPVLAKNESSVDIESLRYIFLEKTGGTLTGTLNAKDINANVITANNPIIVNSPDAPFKVQSKKLVKNLNVEYLNGVKGEDFAVRHENEAITGEWTFENSTTFEQDVKFNKSLVSESGFSPGFNGFGWKLDNETNTLTIDNLVVRKVLNVYELVVNKINATNGSLWVSDAAKIDVVKLMPGDSSGLYSDEFEFNPNYYQYDEATDNNVLINIYENYYNGDFYDVQLDGDYTPFRPNDLIRCQRFTGTSINYYDAIVTNTFNDNKIIIRLSNKNNDLYSSANVTERGVDYTDQLNSKHEMNSQGDPVLYVNVVSPQTVYNGQELLPDDVLIKNEVSTLTSDRFLSGPENGDGLVRIGNTVNPDRQGAIYLTSNDVQGPYIDINSDMIRPDYSVLKPLKLADGRIVYQKPLKVRLGNLNGIYDPAFGIDQPEGYGLYGENVFIKGRLVQVAPDGSENPVIVYRGEWSPNLTYYLNNQVTFEKQLYICLKNEALGLEQSPNNPTYWKLISESGEGSVGPQGPSIEIVTENLFMYKDNYETFVGPEYITAGCEISNLEYSKVEWYILLNDGSERLLSSLQNLLIFPEDILMQQSYGPGIYWQDQILTLKLKVYGNGIIYTDIESIFKQSSGSSSYKVEIISSRGNIFKEGWSSTTLKALLYYDNTRITDFTGYQFVWEKYDREGIKDESWSGYQTDKPDEINISDKDVNFRATFNCSIYKNGLRIKL